MSTKIQAAIQKLSTDSLMRFDEVREAVELLKGEKAEEPAGNPQEEFVKYTNAIKDEFDKLSDYVEEKFRPLFQKAEKIEVSGAPDAQA